MRKSVLITGASSGIGYHTAKYFIDKDYRVYGSVRNEDDALKLKKELGYFFTPLIFDVADATAIKKAVKQVTESLSDGEGLSCLVNNAGMSVNGPLAYIDPEKLNKQFDVNVTGVIRVTQAFLPLLGFNNNLPKGIIINIGSVSGLITRPYMGPYSASKHAIEALSDAMRREFGQFGIKVALVEPGPIKSEIWTKARKTPNEYKGTPYEKMYDNIGKAVDTMEGIALPTEKVSALIHKIAESSNPKTRYLIAPKKGLIWTALHLMSDKMIDRMFEKQFKKFQ